MELYLKDMIHRNVSMENIVFGRKIGNKYEPGYCGALIDLHLAIDVSNTRQISADLRTVRASFASLGYTSHENP